MTFTSLLANILFLSHLQNSRKYKEHENNGIYSTIATGVEITGGALMSIHFRIFLLYTHTLYIYITSVFIHCIYLSCTTQFYVHCSRTVLRYNYIKYY